MGSRFSDISRGPSLNAQYQKYQAWLAMDAGQRSTAYDGIKLGTRAEYEREPAWVSVFNETGGERHYPVAVIKAAQPDPSTTLLQILTGIFSTSAPTGDVSQNTEYKTARCGLRQPVNASATKQTRTSRITGAKYTGYDTNSASMPFGRKNVTETYPAAKTDIQGNAALATWRGAGSGRGIFFKQELSTP